LAFSAGRWTDNVSGCDVLQRRVYFWSATTWNSHR